MIIDPVTIQLRYLLTVETKNLNISKSPAGPFPNQKKEEKNTRVQFFFCEVDPHWDSKTPALWSVALSLSFKFIGYYLGVQLPYQGPRSNSALPLLFVADPSWQSSRSESFPFPTPGIIIEYVPTFPFLHHISCMRSLGPPYFVQHILQIDMPS